MTTPAGTGTPRPGGARPNAAHRPAPWVRTRLSAAPLTALLTAALVFGTVFLAAAFPRALDRGTDDALREFLRSRGPAWTSLFASAEHHYDAGDLDQVAAKLAAHPGETFRFAGSGPVYGARGDKQRAVLNPGLARPDGLPPRIGLLHLHGLTDHATLTAGRWPTAGVGPSATAGPVQVALSRNAAGTIGIHLGDVLDGGSSSDGAVRAEVVGLYTADDPDDPYWADLPCPEKACLQGAGSSYWTTGGVIDAGALPRLADWGYGATDFWRLPVDTATLRADRLPTTGREIAAYVAGPTAIRLAELTGRQDLRISSALPRLFEQAAARQAAAAPLTAIGPAGLAGVGAVVLCLAAALTADRRTTELRLLRARGGSRGGVLLRLLGEGAVTVLPAAAAATALAFWLLPAPRWTGAALAALATTLLALLGFPARAALLRSAPRAGGGRRRLVAECAVLAVTVAAAAEVRRRGVVPPGDGPDPLLVAAPLLLALTGGLLLARLQPVLVCVLARAAGRRRGLIGFLGLARAARGTGGRPRPSVLPVLALLLAVTTAGFGATVLDAVDGARLRAARGTVGGDAAVSAPAGTALPPGFTTARAALPGVRTATAVRSESEAFVLGADSGSTRVTALIVDPREYAELSRSVGRGEFDPAVLAGGADGPDAPVPALFSAELARQLTGGHPRLRMPNGWELRATAAGTLQETPALEGSGRRFIVLPAGPAIARLPHLGGPNLWFATGEVDERQLRALVRRLAAPGAARGSTGDAGTGTPPAPASASASVPASEPTSAPASAAVSPPAAAPLPGSDPARASTDPDAVPAGYLVRTSAALAAELAGDPLQRSAARLFWAAVLGAAGFALLAVLLTLLRAAPERVALLARLRTMGLRPRQGLALIIAETLPQTLAAAAGGGVAALAALALLGPAIDLSVLVGAPVPAGLRPAVPPVLLQVLGLAGLVSAGVLAEALIAGRRQISTELRVGDQR
ncbi:hypothetical protein [Kitasatospora sp. NPDC050543]|uniref:hypothetical protein n=1 Tax=Kitasatospora sp. NPDC050543 TaxID=3364054 RepID=UPI0037BD4BFB